MGTLMIRCPVTAEPIPTGMKVEPTKFERQALFVAYAPCPHCGVDHEWHARDAWIEADAQEDARTEASPPDDRLVPAA